MTAQNRLLLLIFLSKEYFPGPVKKSTRKLARYNKESSLSPKAAPACTMNVTTAMEMMNGISATRVNKPKATKIAQKNSAKMVACKDKAGPNPSGSANRFR